MPRKLGLPPERLVNPTSEKRPNGRANPESAAECAAIVNAR
jgi:hypothetical protein